MKLNYMAGTVIEAGAIHIDCWVPPFVEHGWQKQRGEVYVRYGGDGTDQKETMYIRMEHANDLSMIEAATVDELYSAHAMEHLHPSHAQEIMGEFQRVLKPGGRMHHITPDFDEMVKLWQALHSNFELGKSTLDMERYQTIVNVTLCPFLFGNGYPQHKSLWNKNVAEFILRRWGFDNITVETIGTDLHFKATTPTGVYNTLRVTE